MTRSCCKHNRRLTPVSVSAPPVPDPAPPVPVSTPSPPPRSEPVMRRWPHPVGPPAPPEEDVRKLLQRQTELLLEVRALLDGLMAERDRRE